MVVIVVIAHKPNTAFCIRGKHLLEVGANSMGDIVGEWAWPWLTGLRPCRCDTTGKPASRPGQHLPIMVQRSANRRRSMAAAETVARGELVRKPRTLVECAQAARLNIEQGVDMNMRMIRRFRLALACVAMITWGGGWADARAWSLAGDKQIIAQARDGHRTVLGQVRFTPGADGRVAFAITWAREPFEDFFLSMREFKCLNGGDEISCQVPYPYAHPGTVSANDWRWLEHNLLFMYKSSKAFGANLRNGLYYKLKLTPQGLRGDPQAIDLNHISAPHDDLNQPPYGQWDRDAIAPGVRWLDVLWIE